MLAPGPGGKAFFGAEDFQKFLERELFPEIEARYRENIQAFSTPEQVEEAIRQLA